MRHLGRYEICGLLGRGGMSLVYKVRLPVIEKIMALKLHHPHPILVNLWGEEALRTRFIQEAVLMARLRHPNLLAIWDFDEAAGTPFLVTEYYCHNLGTLIGESGELERPTRRLRPDRIFHYGRQMLKGLDRLHQAGIVHRDIKPFNLLITEGEVIKIGDFGLSLLRGEPQPGPDNLKVGSPYYAAPEQEQDPDRVDGQADLYSVGVTLYRLATGLLPSEAGQPPSRLFPELDSEWDTFLSKAIAFDKQARYGTAGEMLRALEQLRGHWETRPKTDCPAVPVPAATARGNGPANPLRRNPAKLPPAEAPAFFQVDALWRPRSFSAPAWKVHPDGTVADLSHGLRWEQSGSEYPLTWPEAGLYVQDLNRKRFAGRTDWRLPTVEELCSLITEVPGDHAYCLALPFATAQKFLWSADRRSFNAAWFVSIDLGFVFWQDFTCHYHARAVCSS